MKNDWRIIQILIIINILGRGYYNLVRFINDEKLEIFNLSLSPFWYLPSVIIALLVLLASLLLLLNKQYATKVLAVTVLVDGIYFTIYALIAFIPNIASSWYFLILSLIIGLLQLGVGRKLLK